MNNISVERSIYLANKNVIYYVYCHSTPLVFFSKRLLLLLILFVARDLIVFHLGSILSFMISMSNQTKQITKVNLLEYNRCNINNAYYCPGNAVGLVSTSCSRQGRVPKCSVRRITINHQGIKSELHYL